METSVWVCWVAQCREEQAPGGGFPQAQTHHTIRVSIQGTHIEIVEKCSLNNKLDWNHKTGALYRKVQSRLYVLRRL